MLLLWFTEYTWDWVTFTANRCIFKTHYRKLWHEFRNHKNKKSSQNKRQEVVISQGEMRWISRCRFVTAYPHKLWNYNGVFVHRWGEVFQPTTRCYCFTNSSIAHREQGQLPVLSWDIKRPRTELEPRFNRQEDLTAAIGEESTRGIPRKKLSQEERWRKAALILFLPCSKSGEHMTRPLPLLDKESQFCAVLVCSTECRSTLFCRQMEESTVRLWWIWWRRNVAMLSRLAIVPNSVLGCK